MFQVPGVVRYLFWLDKPAVFKNIEIQTLKDWITRDLLNAAIENLKTGHQIKIPSGPFKGKDGIVEEVGKNRVQLILHDIEIKVTLTRN